MQLRDIESAEEQVRLIAEEARLEDFMGYDPTGDYDSDGHYIWSD